MVWDRLSFKITWLKLMQQGIKSVSPALQVCCWLVLLGGLCRPKLKQKYLFRGWLNAGRAFCQL